MELEKRFRAQTWVISIATAILTPLLSGTISAIVVVYQLSNEHSFISRQKSEEKQQSLLDEKKRLVGEASRLSGEMLGIRRQLALDALIAGSIPLTIAKEPGHEGELEQATKAAREDAVRFHSIHAEVRSIFKMSSFYFGSKAQEAVREFDSIEPPSYSANLTPNYTMKEITSDFTAQLKAEDEYAKSIDEILDAMATEVATDLKAPSK